MCVFVCVSKSTGWSSQDLIQRYVYKRFVANTLSQHRWLNYQTVYQFGRDSDRPSHISPFRSHTTYSRGGENKHINWYFPFFLDDSTVKSIRYIVWDAEVEEPASRQNYWAENGATEERGSWSTCTSKEILLKRRRRRRNDLLNNLPQISIYLKNTLKSNTVIHWSKHHHMLWLT